MIIAGNFSSGKLQQDVLFRQLGQRRKGARHSLERIIGVFFAVILALDDPVCRTKHVTLVVNERGVLAKFANAWQVGGELLFLTEHVHRFL